MMELLRKLFGTTKPAPPEPERTTKTDAVLNDLLGGMGGDSREYSGEVNKPAKLVIAPRDPKADLSLLEPAPETPPPPPPVVATPVGKRKPESPAEENGWGALDFGD